MALDGRKNLACAVYTRKSSEEGLEQEFNSLDAQREACEAYILSQRHEGWRVVPTLYDDGGFSGGNMERPALAQLMEDIRSRKIDVVVVYKVDRLTRSLSDFAKIVEVFDAQGVSFVSVTQQFNTTSSMGRLTLNVLLSFAQFEREVTGERIRDKIAASKRKGMFMGGGFPLGYDLQDHKLVVNHKEAEAVRTIFTLYKELRDFRRLKAELDGLGIVTKVRTSECGRVSGGKPFARGNLYYLLHNRTYRGEILHKGQIHAGQHEAIIDRTLWDEVQEIVTGNKTAKSMGERSQHPSPLAGLIFDDCGNRLTPSHTKRGTVRYRYYVCEALLERQPEKAGVLKRVPAVEIEDIVTAQVRGLLDQPGQLIARLLGKSAVGELKQIIVASTATVLSEADQCGQRIWWNFVRTVVSKVVTGADEISITFDQARLAAALGLPIDSNSVLEGKFTITAPVRLTRSGRQKRMVIADDQGQHRLVNENMVMAVARALRWDREIRAGASMREIAKREDLSTGYVTRVLPLAFLAPDIIQEIYEGRQPLDLKVKALSKNLPLDWVEQRRVLGFPAR